MNRTIASSCFPRCIRNGALMFSCLAAALLSGCSVYNDQFEVPGTDQRIIVGTTWALFGPFKKAWVMEGDQVESLRIVKVSR